MTDDKDNPVDLVHALATFEVRSAERDRKIDETRLASVSKSVGEALEAVAAERAGIIKRLERLVDRPADHAIGRHGAAKRRKPSLQDFTHVEERLRCLAQQAADFRRIQSIVLQMQQLPNE